MPLWSVEEWRARIGSSWAALGRPVGCSSRRKERRLYVCCLPTPGAGGGGMVMSLDRTIPMMMTIVTLLILTMSLTILLPLEAGCSPIPHSAAMPMYSEWQTTVPISDITIVETMELDQKIESVHASLLLKCGDIEANPGPLGREDLEKIDNSYVLSEDDFREIYRELVIIKAGYYQLGIELGLRPGEMEAIQQAHSQNVAQALIQVLLAWLKQLYNVEKYGPPTWRRLVEAVDSPSGGNNHALAVGIASKHCEIGTPSKHVILAQPHHATLASTESVPRPLDRWRQLLMDFYLASQSLSDAWPPLKTVQFVQLALVQQKETARHIGLKTIGGDIDAVYGHKINTNFFDLFTDLQRSSLYLLEGRPGSGKTTLMIYVTNQWAKGKIMTSQSIKLVFLVQLRRLGGRDDVYLQDLLQVACSDFPTEDMQQVLKYISENRGEGVVFLLDGFDEYTPGKNPENFISRLIMKNIFCRSIVVVSSRPDATQPFRHVTSKWIEVVGFFEEEVIQYIKQSGEVERAQGLIQHLEQHPNLMNLCYLPLHCAMLVFLYEPEDAALPNTETEFYRDFTLSILIRNICKKSESTNLSHKLKSFDCLPHRERKIFDRICKLAFEATVASQQIFEKSELDKLCFDDSYPENTEGSLGLVVTDRYFVKYGIDETYTFLHLTFQEYLAAVHIAGLSDSESEQINIVSTHCSQKHLYVTWRFLFGMLDYSKEGTVNLFKLVLDATRGDSLLHIQCAYESQHRSACTDVLRFHEYNLKFNNTSAFELTCITYVLKTAEYTKIKLEFSSCDFCVDEAVALLKGVGDCQLSLTMFWGKAVQSVVDALSLVTVPDLIELFLFGGDGGSVSMKDNLKHSTNLRKLELGNVDITDCGLEEGFKHWPNLKELRIGVTSCPLTVLEAIKHCANLVELTILGCRLGVSEVQVLRESIKFISKLHTIDLWNNNLTDESIQYLTEVIKSARNLQTLKLMDNQFTPKGKELLEEAVKETQ